MDLIAKGLTKQYFRQQAGSNVFTAVQPTDLTLHAGELAALTGRSGGGKSTLLNMLCGLLRPSGGQVLLGGTDIYTLEEAALARFRNEHIGIIPQGRSLLDTLTVRENILLPQTLYCGGADSNLTERAEELMRELGIADLGNELPPQLSGGEIRRAAIVRTLLGRPELIFADEPTGDLDDENTAVVLRLLRRAADEGAAVFLVTHEEDLHRAADRVLVMTGGQCRDLCEQ